MAVARVMILPEFLEHLFAVETRMLVTAPGVNRIASGAEPQPIDSLGECAVGIAFMSAEFHEHARAPRFNHPERERDVAMPAGDVGQTVRCLERDGSNNA